MPRDREFWVTCFLPVWGCKACCGRPARPARSLRRMCWTGWVTVFVGAQNFLLTSGGGAGAGDEFRQQCAGLRWKTGGLHLIAGAFVIGERRSDRGDRQG